MDIYDTLGQASEHDQDLITQSVTHSICNIVSDNFITKLLVVNAAN